MTNDSENVKEINMKNECYYCKHKIKVPESYHIGCNKPDKNMVGNKHGIVNGWFFYPTHFDPVWKEKKCDNYESAKSEENNED